VVRERGGKEVSIMTPSVKMHLSLNVASVERSVAFYEAFFGKLPHKRRPGYANFDVETPPLKLALNERAPSEGVEAARLDHLGLQVATREQVDAARDRLTAAGLATFDEKDTTCCYALQDKIWVHDPDGNAWEVYVLLDDREDADPTACCETTSPLISLGRMPGRTALPEP